MTERRYDEHEVARIFERATEVRRAALPAGGPSDGLTLAELQAIGRDVGIPGDAIARAARSLDAGPARTTRRLLGLPLGVGHTVELDRPVTEEEWQHLVVDLRETFGARGKVSDVGSMRQWTNGNLEALLERTPRGERLRLNTFREGAVNLMAGGGAVLGIAIAASTAALMGGDVGGRVVGLLTLGIMGLGMLGAGLLPLPGWARLRRRQMEEVGARLAETTALPAPEGEEPGALPPGDSGEV